MDFTHCKIDPSTASRAEIKAEIARLTKLANRHRNLEQALKIFINGSYGACASPYFDGFSVDVAEAVTLQGQALIKYTSQCFDRYFRQFWHRDTQLHEKLGVRVLTPVQKPVTIYNDTDSCYISMDEVAKSCEWAGDPRDLVLTIYSERLEGYIDRALKEYLAKAGVPEEHQGHLDLELETISSSALFLAKKKYILDIIWKGAGRDPETGAIIGNRYEPLTKMKPVGVEIVQRSTPPYVRAKMNDILRYIFGAQDSFSVVELVRVLRAAKEEFRIEDVENISKSTSITDYEAYVKNDRTRVEVASGCPVHTRGAAIHNCLLNSSKHKQKYQLLRSGDKVKWYYAKATNPANNVFAYGPGAFPHEFAPEVDIDMQFKKTVLEVVNRFIVAMGHTPIADNLVVARKLL